MKIKWFKKHICVTGVMVALFSVLGLTNVYANSSETVNIDMTNFPDAKFRKYVTEAIDADDNGVLSVEERMAVSEIQCSEMGIYSLQGVEYFTNMKSLFCGGNRISQLDVSDCVNLQYLDCSDNRLVELDVTGLSNLEKLECRFNKLNVLKVSGLSNLNKLDCSINKLNELDVSGCNNLCEFICYENSLNELNVSGCDKLDKLDCSINQLIRLDVTAFRNLYVTKIV